MTATRTVRPQNAQSHAVSAEIPAVPLTIEGYSVLHQMMRFRWAAWRPLRPALKTEIVHEASGVLAKMEQKRRGQSGLYSLLGHKGDLMFVHFRQSFDELNQAELQLAQLRLSDYLEPTTSYLSVIELGLYESTIKTYNELAERGVEPHSEEWKRAINETLARQKEAMRPRLFPEMPKHRYICFYPMDRRRGEDKNWYTVADRRTGAADGRAWTGGPALRRRGQTDHHRLDWLRRLGVGSRLVRRRSAGVQEADLRDAV